MAEIRQGYLDDYTQITSGNIGIGTSVSNEKLEIIGGTTAQELDVTGISTFTHVSGFIKKHTDYTGNIDFDAGDSGTLSGDIVVGTGLTMNVGTAATSSQGSVDSLKVFNMFQPPSGGTNQRPPGKPGALFYNFDFKTIEFFDGNSWRQVDNTTRSGRCVIASGYDYPFYAASYDVIQIPTQGNAVHFGDQFHTGLRDKASTGNSIRGLFASGITSGGSRSDEIEYIALASSGKATDFANLTQNNGHNSGMSGSSTRGIWCGGYGASPNPSKINVIEYVEIMTIGDAIDFGDLTVGRGYAAAFSSGTRGFAAGGYQTPTVAESIDMITMAAKGNAIDFGSLTSGSRSRPCGLGNFTRGIVMGGGPSIRSMDAFTTSSGGNAVDYGNLVEDRSSGAAAGCTHTRGVFAGGSTSGAPNGTNSIEFISMQSSGNGLDFGDLATTKGSFLNCCSDSHGGLGGF